MYHHCSAVVRRRRRAFNNNTCLTWRDVIAERTKPENHVRTSPPPLGVMPIHTERVSGGSGGVDGGDYDGDDDPHPGEVSRRLDRRPPYSCRSHRSGCAGRPKRFVFNGKTINGHGRKQWP